MNYNNMQWLDISAKDEPLSSICLLSHVNINDLILHSKKMLQKGSKFYKRNFTISCESDIDQMPEFNPPKCMPQGNVGTPTKYFIQLINKCLLPSSVITKLGLSLYQPRQGIYSAVEFNYNKFSRSSNRLQEKRLQLSGIKNNSQREETDDSEEEAQSESDDEFAEEWDRFEALHDDPHNVTHSKEKTYEEETEITWEKGGPGLVWYTDNSFWKDRESTRKDDFFNDPTNYDLNIDMQNYYNPSADGGDKDAQDLQSIHRNVDNNTQNIHDPEQFLKIHSSSTAHRLMTKLGWRVGQSLGRHNNRGIRCALDNTGQHPYNKSGLGYVGEKLTPRSREVQENDHHSCQGVVLPAWQRRRLQAKLRARLNKEPIGDIYIGSVFDITDERGVPLEEVEDTALRRVECGLAMKYYRECVRFVPSVTLFKN